MAQGTATKVKKKKKSVLKRIRQTHQRTLVNRMNRTRMRTAVRDLRAAIAAGDAAAAEKLLRPALSALDQALQKGVLPENTANRLKSRLTLACNELRTAKS